MEAPGNSASEISSAEPLPRPSGVVVSTSAVVVFRCRFLAINRSSGDSFGVVGVGVGVVGSGFSGRWIVAPLRLDGGRKKPPFFLVVGVVGVVAGDVEESMEEDGDSSAAVVGVLASAVGSALGSALGSAVGSDLKMNSIDRKLFAKKRSK